MHPGWVRIDCTVVHKTTNAILIDVDTVGEVWIPLSCVNEIHEHDGFVVIDDWIAKEKGLA